jgi:hypothetical protein
MMSFIEEQSELDSESADSASSTSDKQTRASKKEVLKEF